MTPGSELIKSQVNVKASVRHSKSGAVVQVRQHTMAVDKKALIDAMAQHMGGHENVPDHEGLHAAIDRALDQHHEASRLKHVRYEAGAWRTSNTKPQASEGQPQLHVGGGKVKLSVGGELKHHVPITQDAAPDAGKEAAPAAEAPKEKPDAGKLADVDMTDNREATKKAADEFNAKHAEPREPIPGAKPPAHTEARQKRIDAAKAVDHKSIKKLSDEDFAREYHRSWNRLDDEGSRAKLHPTIAKTHDKLATEAERRGISTHYGKGNDHHVYVKADGKGEREVTRLKIGENPRETEATNKAPAKTPPPAGADNPLTRHLVEQHHAALHGLGGHDPEDTEDRLMHHGVTVNLKDQGQEASYHAVAPKTGKEGAAFASHRVTDMMVDGDKNRSAAPGAIIYHGGEERKKQVEFANGTKPPKAEKDKPDADKPKAKPETDPELSAIAKKHLDRDTLHTRNSDSLDFADHHVESVRRALADAHALGAGGDHPASKADIEAIAKKHLDRTTLQTRNSDSLDFKEHGAHSLHTALKAAHEAGKKAAEASARIKADVTANKTGVHRDYDEAIKAAQQAASHTGKAHTVIDHEGRYHVTPTSDQAKADYTAAGADIRGDVAPKPKADPDYNAARTKHDEAQAKKDADNEKGFASDRIKASVATNKTSVHRDEDEAMKAAQQAADHTGKKHTVIDHDGRYHVTPAGEQATADYTAAGGKIKGDVAPKSHVGAPKYTGKNPGGDGAKPKIDSAKLREIADNYHDHVIRRNDYTDKRDTEAAHAAFNAADMQVESVSGRHHYKAADGTPIVSHHSIAKATREAPKNAEQKAQDDRKSTEKKNIVERAQLDAEAKAARNKGYTHMDDHEFVEAYHKSWNRMERHIETNKQDGRMSPVDYGGEVNRTHEHMMNEADRRGISTHKHTVEGVPHRAYTRTTKDTNGGRTVRTLGAHPKGSTVSYTQSRMRGESFDNGNTSSRDSQGRSWGDGQQGGKTNGGVKPATGKDKSKLEKVKALMGSANAGEAAAAKEAYKRMTMAKSLMADHQSAILRGDAAAIAQARTALRKGGVVLIEHDGELLYETAESREAIGRMAVPHNLTKSLHELAPRGNTPGGASERTPIKLRDGYETGLEALDLAKSMASVTPAFVYYGGDRFYVTIDHPPAVRHHEGRGYVEIKKGGMEARTHYFDGAGKAHTTPFEPRHLGFSL